MPTFWWMIYEKQAWASFRRAAGTEASALANLQPHYATRERLLRKGAANCAVQSRALQYYIRPISAATSWPDDIDPAFNWCIQRKSKHKWLARHGDDVAGAPDGESAGRLEKYQRISTGNLRPERVYLLAIGVAALAQHIEKFLRRAEIALPLILKPRVRGAAIASPRCAHATSLVARHAQPHSFHFTYRVRRERRARDADDGCSGIALASYLDERRPRECR